MSEYIIPPTYLYAVALTALRDDDFGTHRSIEASAVRAKDEDTAEATAWQVARDTHPPGAGWHHLRVRVAFIPDHVTQYFERLEAAAAWLTARRAARAQEGQT